MYEQTAREKRKAVKSPLKKGAGPDVRDMKEGDSVGESEPTASSTLSEEGSTAIRILVKAMAFLYSIHDVNFRYLAEEHELGVREHLSGKVNLVFAGTSYNV